MSKKLTIGFVKEKFAEEGYVLISKDYINNKQKLVYICPKHHKHSINWNSWSLGRRCGVCFGNNKPDLMYVAKAFEKEHYKLLSKEYINSASKLLYICSKGHENNTTWSVWNSGYRCPDCSGNKKNTILILLMENSSKKIMYYYLKDISMHMPN